MTNLKSLVDEQIHSYRKSHFGQQPGTVDYVKFGIRAIVSIITTNENYLYNHNGRNGLHKIKQHLISLQDRTMRKENIANQINYDRDSFPSLQYILSPDEFTRSISENSELQLNDTVFVAGDLDLSKFPNIKKLPDKLFVDGDLILSGCSELKELSSKELKVSGSLLADKCKSLRKVTENIRVGGDMNFESCVNLAQLPRKLIHAGYKSDSTQRRINLKDTVICPQYSFFNKTTRSASKLFEQSDNPMHLFEFSDPVDIIIRRFIHASGGSDPLPQLDLSPYEKEILQYWLEMKLLILNFISINPRNQLYRKIATQQVIGILKEIEKDPDDMEAVIASMKHDPFIFVELIQIERNLLEDRGKRAMVKGDEQGLKDLFKQDRQLELLQSFAKDNFGKSLNLVDRLTAMFELRQALGNYLDLPFEFHAVDNQTYSKIKEADIHTALTTINNSTQDTDLEVDITGWHPWYLYKTRTYPVYSTLEECAAPEEQRCGISYDFEEDMIVYNKQSYGYKNFVKHYLQKGLDPINSGTVIWSEVRRFTSKSDKDRKHSTDDVD